MEIKKGDRIEVIKNEPSLLKKGQVGTVSEVKYKYKPYNIWYKIEIDNGGTLYIKNDEEINDILRKI